MLVSLVGNLIALVAAIAAIMGDTWNPKKNGFRRLTTSGRTIVGLAAVGFLVSTFAAFERYRDERERRMAAVEEIDRAWIQLVSPYALLLWELDGAQPTSDANMIRRLLDPKTLDLLNQIDLRGEAPHYHGPWLDNICGSVKRGHEELRRSQSIYVGVVDASLITKMKDVAADYMLESMSILSPCGKVEFDKGYPLRLETITNFRELPRFLEALLVLRIEIDKG